MNIFKVIILLLITFSISACSSSKKNTSETNTGSEEVAINDNSQNEFEKIKERLKNQSENPDGIEDEKKETTTTTAKPTKTNDGTLTPTETLMELDAATVAKDYERIKKVLTKSSIAFFEKQAKLAGKTFKQWVQESDGVPTVNSREIRNEVINQNTATVEAKNIVLETFDKYPLVKEDGVWKVAYDQYFRQKIDDLNKGVKPPK